MNTKKRFALFIAIMLIILTCGCFTAFADDVYATIPGTTTKFYTYLIVSGDAHVPAAEFQYTVGAGTAVAAGTGTLAVLAGPDADQVVVGTGGKTVFSVNQSTTAGAADDNIVNSTAKKYAKNEVIVDFSHVTYRNPGVYRYILTQTATADTTGRIVNDATAKRTIDVYVEDSSGSLAVAGYVMYNGEKADGPSATAASATGKSNIYLNEIKTQNLSIEKNVTGNQGSKDKYFLFTLVIENAGAGTVLDVDMHNAKTAPAKTFATVYEASVMQTANNIATLTADADGKIEHTFYLAHHDIVLVTGLPKGATYAVTEEKEDYTSSAPANASGAIADADIQVTFTNTRSGVVPTGIMLTLVPGVVIVLIAGLGLFVVLHRRKKNSV